MAKKTQTCKRCSASFGIVGTQCPKCGFWNHAGTTMGPDETILLSEVTEDEFSAIPSGPWDPCFSDKGGIVKTGVTLLAGAPGGGKSTMALQLADCIAESQKREVFLVGTEEAVKQIRARAIRLRLKNLHLIRVMPMGSGADLGEALLVKKSDGTYRSCAFIIDSLNGLCGEDQQAAVELATAAKDYAVRLDAPCILIGHVNKGEDFSGKMGLQHVVDTTITLFPSFDEYREMTTVKNRFGPAAVVVPLLMTKHRGLVATKFDEVPEDKDGEYDLENEDEA